jgi:hypothetical protein
MIRHVRFPALPVPVNQPPQRVSSHSCYEQPEQRVLCDAVGHGLPTLANIPLSLRVAFACSTDIAAALVVCVSGCSRDTVCDILQGVPHLIQKVLSWVLLRVILLVIPR